jgi:predicted NBD/HSP70 family sugar kinase
MLKVLGESRHWPVRASPAVPADMRVSNLLRLLAELRQAEMLSRSDLARLTNLGVPTVHRLIQDLLAADLIVEIPAVQDSSVRGRPAVMYRLLDSGVLVAGVDFGNETTRFAIASASGRILVSRARRSARPRQSVVEGIAEEIERLVTEVGASPANLAAIGIGVAAVVDPVSGVLRNPPRHRYLQDLPLGQLLQQRLGCTAIVRQDDHFAAVAEASSAGTFPGANPLVVLEIGIGIGAAMLVDGVTVMGAGGRFGRIAGWPVSTPRRGMAKSTLGASLVASGLVEDYHRREGKGQVFDGESLFAAAAAGDTVADAVLAWAGREIAELVIRLQRFCDPAGIVFGGGFARGFATLEPHLRPHLPAEIVLAPSVLGENAVAIGAILAALPCTEAWVTQRLSALDAQIRS